MDFATTLWDLLAACFYVPEDKPLALKDAVSEGEYPLCLYQRRAGFRDGAGVTQARRSHRSILSARRE